MNWVGRRGRAEERRRYRERDFVVSQIAARQHGLEVAVFAILNTLDAGKRVLVLDALRQYVVRIPKLEGPLHIPPEHHTAYKDAMSQMMQALINSSRDPKSGEPPQSN